MDILVFLSIDIGGYKERYANIHWCFKRWNHTDHREEAIENNVNSLISNKGNYKEKMNYSLKSTGTIEKLFRKKSHCISILYQNNLIDE